MRTWRAEIARRLIASCQPSPLAGISVSPTTSSTIPSRISSLLATCLYNDLPRRRAQSPNGALSAGRALLCLRG